MLYLFLSIILAAAAGVLFLVLRKHKFTKASFRPNSFENFGERFWIRRIKRNPKNARFYKKLANWYVKNGRDKHAVETLNYALKLEPEDVESKSQLDQLRKEA